MDYVNREIHIWAFRFVIPPPSASPLDDYYEWRIEGSNGSTFSSAQTWEALRPKEDEKQWADSVFLVKIVWFGGSVPKHSFNMWVANYDRLPTRTRLASWGLQLQTNCCLCSLEPETRDHLLLTCQFSKDVWNQVFSRLNPPSQLFVWGL
ncbi:BnaC05g29180D [Brassica napus]|uniref:BnaC05g29180D protein n=1 Tax=Brassica napus TaxID=3708 RepID=A0A078GZ90_BRANA|nr:BnaC05g29180D [Brassica napus]